MSKAPLLQKEIETKVSDMEEKYSNFLKGINKLEEYKTRLNYCSNEEYQSFKDDLMQHQNDMMREIEELKTITDEYINLSEIKDKSLKAKLNNKIQSLKQNYSLKLGSYIQTLNIINKLEKKFIEGKSFLDPTSTLAVEEEMRRKNLKDGQNQIEEEIDELKGLRAKMNTVEEVEEEELEIEDNTNNEERNAKEVNNFSKKQIIRIIILIVLLLLLVGILIFIVRKNSMS